MSRLPAAAGLERAKSETELYRVTVPTSVRLGSQKIQNSHSTQRCGAAPEYASDGAATLARLIFFTHLSPPSERVSWTTRPPTLTSALCGRASGHTPGRAHGPSVPPRRRERAAAGLRRRKRSDRRHRHGGTGCVPRHACLPPSLRRPLPNGIATATHGLRRLWTPLVVLSGWPSYPGGRAPRATCSARQGTPS